MKRLVLALLLAVLFVASSSAQLQKLWSKPFTFGYDNGQALSSSVDDSGIVVSGYAIQASTASTMAGLMRFSLNGDTLWSRLGQNWSKSIQTTSSRVGNYIFWTQETNGNDSLIQTDLKGNLIRSEQLPYALAYISTYGSDSLVIVAGGTVAIMDTTGTIVRSAAYVSDRIGGSITLRIRNNILTIIGIHVMSQNAGFVARVDLTTLSTVWKKDIQNVIRCFGDVDDSGNVYFAGSEVQSDGTLKLRYLKIGPDGNILADSKWYPRNTQETNYENWVNGVAYHDGIVVVGGAIQNGNAHAADKNAYFSTLNALTGERTWDSSFTYGGSINQIETTAFAPDGDLIMIVNTYPPYLNRIEKYRLLVTDVVPDKRVLPQSFELSQNYPNPFNPSTSIKFQVHQVCKVNLRVYDLLGREVATLIDGEKSAGTYTVTFDGKNLASGTYLYRLQTSDGLVEVKKMVLMK